MNRRDLLAGLGGGLLFPGAASAQQRRYQFDPNGDRTLLRLSGAATALKTQAAISPQSLVAKRMTTARAMAPLAMAGMPPRAADALLRLFFASSQAFVGHVESQTPIIGYYSPTLDFWWLTLWSKDAAPVATASKLLPGRALIAGPSGVAPDSPRWQSGLRLQTAIEALRQAANGARTAFYSEFAVDAALPPTLFQRLASGAAEQLILHRRLAVYAKAIVAFAGDARAYPVYDRLLKALNTAAPAAPAGLTAEARQTFTVVAGVPQLLRTRLSPVAALPIQDGWLVASANPVSGRYLLLTAFRPGLAEPLQRLALVDLAGPGRKAA